MPQGTSDALGQARKLLEDRLVELDAERGQVQRALAEISGPRSSKRGPGRPRGARSRAGSTRGDEAVALVAANPGLSASEIAKALEIAPNYVYRVMSDLVKQGRVRKSGRGYHPGLTAARPEPTGPQRVAPESWRPDAITPDPTGPVPVDPEPA